jgi:O-antigen/teichoic acid export membrane protein
MSESPASGIGTRTLRGMFWAYGSYVGGRLLTLVATAILARLLTPKEFGLVALALIFITLFETLSDLGITQALVIAREDELEKAETAFVWTVGLGAGFALLTAALAPAAALFFDQPKLASLLPVLGLRFLFRSLSATHYALAQKHMDFRSRTAAELADAVIRGGAGVTLALAGFGAWSLVLGYLAGSIALGVVLWILVPWRPKLRPQRAHLRQMLRFGGTLTGVNILAAIQSNTDYVFIGRFLGATDLGLYTLGFRLPELLILNLSVVAAKVLYPAFARIDRSNLGAAIELSLRYTFMFGLPITAALAVLANPLVLTIFGDNWDRSVAPMQLLTLYALGVTLGIPVGTAFKAVGRVGMLLALIFPATCLLIASVAIFVNQGIVAVAACVAGVTVLFDVIGIAIATRQFDVLPRQIWNAAWSPLVATAGMAAVLGLVVKAIDTPWLTLVVGGALGGVVYLALLWFFARDDLLRLRDTAFPRMRAAEQELIPPEPEIVGQLPPSAAG